jgi:hypothetical protein
MTHIGGILCGESTVRIPEDENASLTLIQGKIGQNRKNWSKSKKLVKSKIVVKIGKIDQNWKNWPKLKNYQDRKNWS